MKLLRNLAGLVVLGLAVGCQPRPEPAPEPPATPVATEPEAWCRVCEVDRGEKLPEYLPSRLDVRRDGQVYRFCADDCRARFDANPGRYVAGDPPREVPANAVDAAAGDG